ncbi:MAG TPA: prepilin-type N-terminal cleavage/methylation domain-containing protein [Nevskiaceae bacterium]|nr:prepilin-type N-terminal cleavage/methylation domain-containing protein [Nevskiaceae bacterium]
MRSSGFTLVELVITIAVAGVLLAMAVPSFTRTIVSNRLATTANGVIASLNAARLEAIRRNAVVTATSGRTSVQLCSNTTGNNGSGALQTACGTSGGAVYTLEPDGTASKVVDAVLVPDSISLGTMTGLRYAGSGQASSTGSTGAFSGLVADVSTSKLSTSNHRCIYLTTGSIISTCITSTACANSEPANCTTQ